MNTLSHYAAMFSEFDFGEQNLADLEIAPFNVSIFNRWLSEQEAEDSEIMFYDLAVSCGKLADYHIGEEKFINFYRKLSVDGVVCNYPRPLRIFDKYNRILEKVIFDSLREKRKFDMYFIAHDVRVLGGYDRTDLFLPRNKEKIRDIHRAVGEAGLYVLS
ncbi:hypothetical protein [Phyllobacterium sp. YR531]|uniref:hypothetical protein n=1 Tax=Phyllobacterium sp. YR531 TaxID=1144343 RepID=UPI00026F902E|nr:hypothetical protein [Phyllobacterium sp. YR531]EJN01405.1 hypothetical protein PMI41_03487 [Phyllobacterium sp. YR531]